jgi:hypothetical protein
MPWGRGAVEGEGVCLRQAPVAGVTPDAASLE